MSRRLTEAELKLVQSWSECINSLQYARGENRIVLEFMRIGLEEKLEEAKLLDIVQYLPAVNLNNSAKQTIQAVRE